VCVCVCVCERCKKVKLGNTPKTLIVHLLQNMSWRIALYENRYACGSSLFILGLLTAILAMALCMAPGCNMCGNGCEGIFNVEPTDLGAFPSVQSIIELPARHRRMVLVNNRTASLLPSGGEFVPSRGGESFIPFQREQIRRTEPSLAYMTGSGSTLSFFFFGVNGGVAVDVGVNVSSFKDVFVDDSSVWMLTTDGHLLRTSLDHPNTTQALSLAQSCQTRAYIIPSQVQTGGGVLILCNSQLVSVTGTTVLSATDIDLSVGSPIDYRYGATRWVTLAEGSSYVIFNVPAVVISTVVQQLPKAYPTHLARENY